MIHAEKLVVNEALGNFFDLIVRLGNTSKDKKGLAGFFDEWYTTGFRCDELSVKIHRWMNLFAIDDYLDSISIEEKGKLVYKAQVNRYNSRAQIVNVFNRDEGWTEKVESILLEYN